MLKVLSIKKVKVKNIKYSNLPDQKDFLNMLSKFCVAYFAEAPWKVMPLKVLASQLLCRSPPYFKNHLDSEQLLCLPNIN